MITAITIDDIQKLVSSVGIKPFFRLLITAIEEEYARWDAFIKSPRHAVHAKEGVIELMPIADDKFYSFKYVNGHPGNPALNKLNVIAIGFLSDMKTGYPLIISEMTLLTALRTAATSALAAKYLARKNTTSTGRYPRPTA